MRRQRLRVELRLDGELKARYQGRYLTIQQCGLRVAAPARVACKLPRKDHNAGGKSDWMQGFFEFLRSSKQRLLLADEVGLGKTIEAGFILCEMLARHPHTFRRVLIVCKALLCFKWQMEMRKRFDLRFDIWRAGELREFHRRYREDKDLELRAICSLESFRNTGVMQDWEAVPPPLDVLIIDEAHHLKNSETKVHKACRVAAEAADAVLALTATPIQIGSRDLFNLLSLLDEEEFASFQYFEACMLFNSQIVAAEQKIARQDPDRFEAAHTMLRDC